MLNLDLGQFQIKEDYESLKICLEMVFLQIQQLEKIVINGLEYELEYFFSSDYKLLLLLLGLQVSIQFKFFF